MRRAIDHLPRHRAPALLVLAALAVAGTAGSARAATGPVFSVQPAGGSRGSYFIYKARAGQQISGRVRVLNVGARAGAVFLYATDATTGQTSGAVYESASVPKHDVGAWTSLSRRHLNLSPGQSALVNFRLVVPSAVRGGQHLGGIVASPVLPHATLTARKHKGSFHVNIRELSVLAVEVNLPGSHVPRLAIRSVRPGSQPRYQTLLIGLANPGLVLTKARGTLSVANSHGQRVRASRFRLDTFVPHTAIDDPVQLHGRALPAGSYTATVTLRYGPRRIQRTLPFTITRKQLSQVFGSAASKPPITGSASPVLLIIGGLALLLAGFGGAAIFFRGRARRTAAPQ